ncbi:MAG: hypothetical protein IKN96_00060 [Oscillibacter sp.]|nr:hypothetical protein [Oscillibacter sp.]
MKRLAIVCAIFALLTACGAAETSKAPVVEKQAPEIAEPVPELEIEPPPDDIDPETGDRVLLSAEASVSGGRVLTVEGVGQALTEPGAAVRYGLRAVRVYENGELLQTLFARDFIDGDMMESPAIEDALIVRDANFDGADDIDLCGGTERVAPLRYYFLWDADANGYVYGFKLRGASVDPDKREITASYPLDSSVDCADVWRYAPDGSLQLAERKTEDWKRGSEDFPLVEYYVFQDGEAVLTRQEFTNYNDEGLTVREVREVVNGELKPVRLEILEGADGEFRVVRTEEIPQEPVFPDVAPAPMDGESVPADGETENEPAPAEDAET